jgi:hypothetical protein
MDSQSYHEKVRKLLLINTLTIGLSVGLLVFSFIVVRSPEVWWWFPLEALQHSWRASASCQQQGDHLLPDLSSVAANSLLVVFVLSYGVYLSAPGLGLRKALFEAGCPNVCRRLSLVYLAALIACIIVVTLLFAVCVLGARIPSLILLFYPVMQTAMHGLPPIFSAGLLDVVWVFFGVNSGYLLILQLALCRIVIGR